MEDAIRRGIERDERQLQRLDDRLAGRDVVGVDQADETQEGIRRDREPVQRYLDDLLSGLDRVHGMQIDRSSDRVDPLSVPEHERPTLALRQEQERADRVRGLTLSAAQQLGTGHPAVVRWLEQHASAVERTQDRSVERTAERPILREPEREAAPKREAPRKIPPTAYQRKLVQAIRDLRVARGAFEQFGGAESLDRAKVVRADVYDLGRRLKDQQGKLAEHQARQPSRLRFSATEAWEARRDELQEQVDRVSVDLGKARRELGVFERQNGGRPVEQILRDLETSRDQASAARQRTLAVEQQLARTGPAALDQQRLVRLLGRREELSTDVDRRRYDQLAGRIAVADVVRSQERTPDRWLLTTKAPDRDLALWRDYRGMSLSRPQQEIVQERRQELERSRDVGYDLGR